MSNPYQFISDAMSKSMNTTQCPVAEKIEPRLRIRITVFIDGTGNNLTNTDCPGSGEEANVIGEGVNVNVGIDHGWTRP